MNKHFNDYDYLAENVYQLRTMEMRTELLKEH